MLIKIEGHCKYGDRCTFAHGDQDMRAKFVKAELLYSSAAQPQVPEQVQLQAPAPAPVANFGTVDYGAFSQPPTMPATTPTMPVPEVQQEVKVSEPVDYGSDFQIPTFDPQNLQDGAESPSVFPSYEFKSNGILADPISNVLTSSTSPGLGNPVPSTGEMSKFGFGYEALSENLDELELTSNAKDQVEKFSQAKYQIEMGNTEKGNEILNEMMKSNEIKYKEFSNIDQHILNTFAPISD